jgi:hypothetical protein
MKGFLKRTLEVDTLQAHHHLLSSLVTGTLVQLTLSPVWVVKVNQQLQIFTSFSQGCRGIYDSGGFKSFYRGIVPSIGSSFHGAVQFAFYEEFKVIFAPWQETGTVIATILSKTAATVTTSPIEVVKVRMRMVSSEPSLNVLGVVRKIHRLEGLSGFYRGMVPALARIMPSQVLMFSTYEYVKKILQPSL